MNKFDWTVSAGDDEAETAPDFEEKRLYRNIEAKLGAKFRPAQKFMIENRDNNVIMVAPTGSGKTEAALLWLHGEKGFYTLPLKVSSNAIYKRIRDTYQYEDVALLHSDSLNGYLKEAEDLEDGYRNYEKAKRFSCPLTVCTVDQLFRFVYKALGTEIFAATLKYSIRAESGCGTDIRTFGNQTHGWKVCDNHGDISAGIAVFYEKVRTDDRQRFRLA